LALLGVGFDVIEPDFEEQLSTGRSIDEEVLDFAVGKARSIAAQHPDSLIIGSDTMIFLDGAKIGKPKDLGDARRILSSLAGKTHRIYTAVAILDTRGGPGLSFVDQVCVDMRPYTEQEMEDYLGHNESLDKAGAYSIQGEGSKLIAAIRGDYLAAVGLPLRPIADYLCRQGITFPLDVEQFYRKKAYLNWRLFRS
jgi:septum formation protein